MSKRPDPPDPLHTAILEWLSLELGPQSTFALRSVLKIRRATLIAALESLRGQGLVVRNGRRWRLSSSERPKP